ncbi:hypothetical protein BDK51DRAFT_37837 [Blyttiomyces helicus]|uniref:Uncharacterized protein n=1 Tax=Blyttiomyces helicus TaxID=388810 RepID=A0A4P9W367_9FUNG|nr:hypothetical protein BDK51DRAFT_37837 [Blyttiomyces helicus]|eukprot:RKO86731.1 hypothetical protein BDK51DRAFT_37837 [Blyttiomyces helicus]
MKRQAQAQQRLEHRGKGAGVGWASGGDFFFWPTPVGPVPVPRDRSRSDPICAGRPDHNADNKTFDDAARPRTQPQAADLGDLAPDGQACLTKKPPGRPDERRFNPVLRRAAPRRSTHCEPRDLLPAKSFSLAPLRGAELERERAPVFRADRIADFRSVHDPPPADRLDEPVDAPPHERAYRPDRRAPSCGRYVGPPRSAATAYPADPIDDACQRWAGSYSEFRGEPIEALACMDGAWKEYEDVVPFLLNHRTEGLSAKAILLAARPDAFSYMSAVWASDGAHLETLQILYAADHRLHENEARQKAVPDYRTPNWRGDDRRILLCVEFLCKMHGIH